MPQERGYAGQRAQFMLDRGATFAVPTWTNSNVVSATDPDLRPCAATPDIINGAHKLRALYEALGAKPTWTCAPYHLPGRPRRGDHIVAGESNAVTFYNSVIGARTNKYGDYLDVACAMIGKAPLAGLHTDEGRKAALLFRLQGIPDPLLNEPILYHLLGHHVGKRAGRRIPAIEGLRPTATEDDLQRCECCCRLFRRRRSVARHRRNAGSAGCGKRLSRGRCLMTSPWPILPARGAISPPPAMGRSTWWRSARRIFLYPEFAQLVAFSLAARSSPDLPFYRLDQPLCARPHRYARAGLPISKQPVSPSSPISAPIIRRPCAVLRAAS